MTSTLTIKNQIKVPYINEFLDDFLYSALVMIDPKWLENERVKGSKKISFQYPHNNKHAHIENPKTKEGTPLLVFPIKFSPKIGNSYFCRIFEPRHPKTLIYNGTKHNLAYAYLRIPPKLYFLDEVGENDLFVPRGFLKDIIEYCDENQIEFEIDNQTHIFKHINFEFSGALYPFQEIAVEKMLPENEGVLCAPTGCLSGDTVININRAKKGGKVTIKHLYLKCHGDPSQTYGPNYNTNIPTNIRAYKLDENRIHLHEIKDVVYSGAKPCYLLTLKNGAMIKATPNHLVQTDKGWRKLLLLKPNDNIMIDSPLPQKNNKNKARNYDKMVGGLWFHPFARKFKSNSYARGWDKTIEYHRAMYEAHINNLTLDEYKKILKYDEKKAKKLKFINIKKNNIHHKDRNHLNNIPENLVEIAKYKHKKLHADYSLFGQGTPRFSKVESVKFSGIEDTYDIICEDPYRNFVANGIVIHNSGKTVIGIYIIAKRRQPTLIIVHTKELLDQWTDRIKTFLDIPGKSIGHIGNGSLDEDRPITIALIQTLSKYPEIVNDYGFLIIDECHRTPSRTFTAAVKKFEGRYILGLSATPYRRDGLSKIIEWYSGPIRYKIEPRDLINTGHITSVKAIIRKTNFIASMEDPSAEYSTLLQEISQNEERNQMIINDVLTAVAMGETCLVLTDRKAHCQELKDMIQAKSRIKTEVLTGDVPTEPRKRIVENVNAGKIKILICTGQLIGEGFDCEKLSALFLTMPIRFSGRVIQYMGRVLRPAKNKDQALVYDYFDQNVRVLYAGMKTRKKEYEKLTI